MKVLDVKSGLEREVSAEEAAVGYQQGAYRLEQGAAIPMRTAHGNLVAVAPQDLATASREGFALASEQEWQTADREARYSTPGQIAATAAEGVGRGLTLGAYDLVAGQIAGREYAEAAAARAEVNPGTAIAGEVVGTVAPMLLTSGGTGAASLAGRAVRGAGVLPRLAAGAGRAAESGAARLLGTGAESLAGRALRGAVGGAVEALPSAIGHQVSRAYVEQRDLLSEQVLAGIGLETLTGGMAGGILSGGAAAARDVAAAAKRSFGHAAPGLERLAIESSALLSGKSADDIAGAWRGRAAIGQPETIVPTDVADRITAAARTADTPEAARAVAKLADVGVIVDGKANPRVVAEYLANVTNPTTDIVHSQLRAITTSEAPAALALRDALADVESGTIARNQFRALSGGDTPETGAMMRGMLGSMVGGAPGAAVGATIGALSSPAQVIGKVAAIERVIRAVDTKLDGGIRGYFARVTDRVAPVARSATIKAATAETHQATYERAKKALDVPPAQRAEAVEHSVRHVREQSPELADSIVTASARASSFLEGKLPRRPAAASADLTPHLSEDRLPRSEVARFARYARAVEDPSVMARDLAAGTLSRETVEAVRSVYPTIYARIRETVIEGLARRKDPLPYQARVKLSMLLGFVGDPSLRPEAIVSMQDAMKLPPPTPPSRQYGSPAKSMSENVMAQMDRLEGILV